MMSNLVGLLELYRATGNPLYLKPAQIAWKDIVDHRLYVTGTASSSEHSTDDFVLPGEEISSVGEGCVTVTFLQLTWELLRLTAEPQYADQLEHTVYNALLGAQDPRTGNICYFTPLNGRKSPSPCISCCVSSEPRRISMIPRLAWGLRREGIAVLFYASGHVSLQSRKGELRIESKTTYPADGLVELTVHPTETERFPLYLRVPAWTAHYQATVGGKIVNGVPGTFLAIEREWHPGDSVKIDMDMTARLAPGGPSYPHCVAIFRGPQALALEQTLNCGTPDLQAAGPRTHKIRLVDARDRLPPNWPGKQACRIEGVAAGNPKVLVLVPFADALVYRVWLLKP